MTSRNKREGWYAGWRPHLVGEGHKRSGKPSKDIDWIPYPHPLNKRIVARFERSVHVKWNGKDLIVIPAVDWMVYGEP